MASPSSNYIYEYDVLSFGLLAQGIRLKVLIGGARYAIIGIALVKVKQIDSRAIELGEIATLTDMRYIFINEKNEPDVSYKEDPRFKSVILAT